MESFLTVDLGALAHNHDVLRRHASGAEVAPVVKADGYGLGAAEVARRLHAEGARTFFLARLSEGERLRRALGADRPADIYVLDGVTPGSAPRLRDARLIPALNSPEQVALWAAQASVAAPLPAALHIDTGMNRLGMRPEDAEALARDPNATAGLRIVHVMSHLACAEDQGSAMNGRQLESFRSVRPLFPDARASLANSAGIFLGPDYAFDVVRPGIALYGGGPLGRADPRFRSVATYEAAVLQVRDVMPGETIGYGATYTAERRMRVAVIAAGYADGLLRAASPGGHGTINGRRAPILGRVSMDLIAVDVSETSAEAGDPVQLFGPDVPVDDLATAANTIAYELLTRASTRAERRYIGAPG